MKVSDVYRFIDTLFPFCEAEDFDNVGLLVGDKNAEVTATVVALDCTDAVIDYSKSVGANLIITHHPVIFNPVKSVTEKDIVYRLVKEGISVISAHTNMDRGTDGVCDTLAQKLGLTDIKPLICDGFSIRQGVLHDSLDALSLAKLCKENIVSQVRYADGKKPIKTVAVCSGSGGDFLEDVYNAGIDAYITSDVKHSVFLTAAHLGITLLDCGHLETEDIIVSPLRKMLNYAFPHEKFYEYHIDEIKRI